MVRRWTAFRQRLAYIRDWTVWVVSSLPHHPMRIVTVITLCVVVIGVVVGIRSCQVTTRTYEYMVERDKPSAFIRYFDHQAHFVRTQNGHVIARIKFRVYSEEKTIRITDASLKGRQYLRSVATFVRSGGKVDKEMATFLRYCECSKLEVIVTGLEMQDFELCFDLGTDIPAPFKIIEVPLALFSEGNLVAESIVALRLQKSKGGD